MAITKTLIEAIPTENSSNQVERWDLKMKYDEGTEGQVDYLKVIYTHKVFAKETVIVTFQDEDNAATYTTTNNFTELNKNAWSLAELTALCPISHWDNVFTAQYNSKITSPRAKGTADESFTLPTE